LGFILTGKVNQNGELMISIATTKLSSKGQVVIPEEVRTRLGLKEGDQFIALGEDDAVIIKNITKPTMKDFDALIDKARRQARSARLKRSDIKKAVAKVRAST
jgi:AbrB family looped-hinge helix DNA binding protein